MHYYEINEITRYGYYSAYSAKQKLLGICLYTLNSSWLVIFCHNLVTVLWPMWNLSVRKFWDLIEIELTEEWQWLQKYLDWLAHISSTWLKKVNRMKTENIGIYFLPPLIQKFLNIAWTTSCILSFPTYTSLLLPQK